MKCAIMQPCYLPWLGHLRLMAMVDRFVFLDDVQYSKNGRDNRNQVLLPDGRVVWLTVPVAREHSGITLNNIRIDVDQRWRRKHSLTLRQSYGRHPHFADLNDLLHLIEHGTQRVLADLNCDLLVTAAKCCNVRAEMVRSSALGVEGGRSERLERLCRSLACDSYVSTPGARGYLEADAFGAKSGVHLDYMSSDYLPYEQQNSSAHVPRLSFVDVVANVGWNGLVQRL
mgnify:CR=1 FL=1